MVVDNGGPGAEDWNLVLVSNVNDGTFYYDSDVWTNGIPFNDNDNNDDDAGDQNALFSAYTTIYVESIKMYMDGTKDGSCTTCTYEFNLADEYRGKYTLQQLVTMGGGVCNSRFQPQITF